MFRNRLAVGAGGRHGNDAELLRRDLVDAIHADAMSAQRAQAL